MFSIGIDTAQVFAVGFPPLLHGLLFWVFASLVVHVCQRLVEHTALSIDPSSRRISASHAALCIGCIVWALDVVGMLMYAELANHVLELVPALTGLVIMALCARLAIPTLSTSTSRARILGAGALLSLGMLAAHFTMSEGYVSSYARVNGLAIALAIATAIGIAAYTAIRHRAAKMKALTRIYIPQQWRDKLLCGAAILVLHWLLVNTFPLQWPDSAERSGGVGLLVIVLLFGIAIATEQLSNMRFDQARQQLLRRGLSLMRTSNFEVRHPEGDIQLSLIADQLPTLLQPEQLALHFQPIANLQRGEVQYEALLRVRSDLLGPLHPEAFLLVCELQGKTPLVDRLILGNAMACAIRWRAQGMEDARFSVNVAPATLLEESFAPWLQAELARHALPGHVLKLELTEHALIASGPRMLASIERLAAIGVGVLMDDFGAGYSSLGTLADLPIAGIKCDRLFMRRLAQDPRRQSLLRHMGMLASEFGLSVVVEGVETPSELQSAAACGIPAIQGYVFCRPMPAAEVPGWHRTHWPLRLAELRAHMGASAADDGVRAPLAAPPAAWTQAQGAAR
jgi:EAL domain-containing protein (putative c-di-GMP-specific phosphodiesterase class I)/NO-binding membrane sensor protein with MHYT domain